MFRAAVLACNRPYPKLGQLLPGRGGSLFALSHLLFGPDPMAGLTPQQRRKVPSRSYWASAQADLRALHSIPVLHESISLGRLVRVVLEDQVGDLGKLLREPSALDKVTLRKLTKE